ncbi:MAG: menaquinone reductase multiheme cytochrome c subunit QrcA [Pseudomonadota bacterium]
MTEHEETKSSDQQEQIKAAGKAEKKPPRGGGYLFFFAGLIISLAFFWAIWPTLLYSKKPQPFQFNHAIHKEPLNKDKEPVECDYCHNFKDNGRFSGIPSFTVCLDCHSDPEDPVRPDSQMEKVFYKEFVTEDGELKKEPDFYVYSKQPDCVYFSHIAHVKKAKLECEKCHGNHGQTPNLRPYYQNWITGYSRDVYQSMKMNDCADCHLKMGKPENNACFVCHK